MVDEREVFIFFFIFSDSMRKKGNYDMCVGFKKIYKLLILFSLDFRIVDL